MAQETTWKTRGGNNTRRHHVIWKLCTAGHGWRGEARRGLLPSRLCLDAKRELDVFLPSIRRRLSSTRPGGVSFAASSLREPLRHGRAAAQRRPRPRPGSGFRVRVSAGAVRRGEVGRAGPAEAGEEGAMALCWLRCCCSCAGGASRVAALGSGGRRRAAATAGLAVRKARAAVREPPAGSVEGARE